MTLLPRVLVPRTLAAGMALVAAAMAVASPATAQDRPSAAALSWYGTYTAQEMIPRGMGQGQIMAPINYRVTVTNDGCRFRSEGVMTDQDIRCTARISGQSLIIGFYSYSNGSMRNEYDVARFRRGQPLLTLTRSGRGLRTTWQGISPGNDQPSRYPHFRKVR